MTDKYKQALEVFHDARKVVDGIFASRPEDEATAEEWADYYEWLTDFADAAQDRASAVANMDDELEGDQ